jgi:hypothetical protein
MPTSKNSFTATTITSDTTTTDRCSAPSSFSTAGHRDDGALVLRPQIAGYKVTRRINRKGVAYDPIIIIAH